MLSFEKLHEIIDQAIQDHGAIRLYYRNNSGRTSVRVVEPFDWDNNYVFQAYCHLRQENRYFKLRNILEIQSFDFVEDALAYNEDPPEAVVAPPVARPVQRQIPSQRSSGGNGQPAPAFPIFKEVTTPEQWSHLLRYYAECLIHEYQQNFIIKPEWLRPFPFDPEEIKRFMQGEISLEFKTGPRLQQNPVASFIEKNYRESHLQLCLGYPFLVIAHGQVAPLIYSTVEITAEYNSFSLRAENFEVSYAALKSLQMTEEEIEAFLNLCDQVQPKAGQSMPGALEGLVIDKIYEIYQAELPRRTDRFEPATIYASPALFWVTGNNITGNLILELQELANVSRWARTSDALKQLLCHQPEHDYSPAPHREADYNLYVTAINDQQLRATQAAKSEPALVVTGPPGTGKSQLVLNLLAQAFMQGETVLFASRNNGAVDVVMDRLQNELKFQGAVRTGNNQNRDKAVQQMKSALNHISATTGPLSLVELEEQYQSARLQTFKAQEQLEQVRKLSGLQISYRQERDQYLSFLPKAVAKIAVNTVPAYQARELESLQSTLSSLLEHALQLKEAKGVLEKRLAELVTTNPIGSELIAEIHHFEDQWGAFAGGFVRKQGFERIDALSAHVQTWLNMIDALELRASQIEGSGIQREKEHKLTAATEHLPEPLAGLIQDFANEYSPTKLKKWLQNAKSSEVWFSDNLPEKLSIWEKILRWITFGLPVKREIRKFNQFQKDIGLLDPAVNGQHTVDFKALVEVAAGYKYLFWSALLRQQLTQVESKLEQIDRDLLEKHQALPEVMLPDLDKLGTIDFDNQALKQALSDLLVDFKNQEGGKDQRLWVLRFPSEPEVIVQHVTKWHNLSSFWSVEASLRHVNSQLASLPDERTAISQVTETSNQLLAYSGQILRSTWLDRARKANNQVIQGVHNYVAAVEELGRGYNSATYQQLKSEEKSNLQYAVQVFPIWATTNLTAKTNFPLENGYFDVVIIDEASQCDIPSALPLLYRARRVVIIGDPNQLRHVATLSKETDQELAVRHGVGSDAFSYNTHSLFDISQRSAGNHPGTLLLNEHYRSDFRIINFSNQEFYNGELVIKTDLSIRNIRKTFLNQYGGMFWLHVDGQTEHPRGTSACNLSELACIQELLPPFLESLKRHELGHATIGIVTPYRDQSDRIQAWVDSLYGNTGQITVGTAHKFQGDERDFMIFSPVLAPGIKPGSQDWLQRTRNLLNVAITRARISLIVVGNWDYCKSLPQDHSFQHLAEYAEGQGNRVVRETGELPIFGRQAPDIVGVVTDPHNPEYNRTTLRRFIASCAEYIWWVDPYFNNHLFDLFWDVFQDPIVRIGEIRLLTAREQVSPGDDRKPQINLRRFQSLQAELAGRGIDFSLRTTERRELPHDRLLYSPGQAINMPPFAGAYGDHRHVSEYTQSKTNRGLFLKYWENAKGIDDESR